MGGHGADLLARVEHPRVRDAIDPRSTPAERRLVDDEARVIDDRGRIVPGLFGIGLASGYVPAGEPSFRGHTNGVWLYQHDTGEKVLQQVGP